MAWGAVFELVGRAVKASWRPSGRTAWNAPATSSATATRPTAEDAPCAAPTTRSVRYSASLPSLFGEVDGFAERFTPGEQEIIAPYLRGAARRMRDYAFPPTVEEQTP